jgi:hypothetical protein
MPGKQVFRFSFWYLWLRLSLLSVGLVVLSTTISQLGAGNRVFNFDHLTFIALIGGGMMVFSILAVLAHIYFFPVTVDLEGISGHMANGRRHRIAWSDLDAVRIVRHVGVQCYGFHSRQGNARIIVPICLKRRAAFEAVLAKRGITITNRDVESAPPQPDLSRRKRPSVTPIREGGYIIITTEERNR